MAKTQIKGKDIGDRTITELDIDITGATNKSVILSTDSLFLLDSAINLSGRVTINNLETYFNNKYFPSVGSMLFTNTIGTYSTCPTNAFGRALLNSVSGTVITGLNADQVDGHSMNQDVLIASSPTFANVTAGTFLGNSVATNTQPATQTAKFDGFGVIGNRPSFYITNSSTIVLCIGAIHGSGAVVTVSSTGIVVTGNITGNLLGNATTVGGLSVATGLNNGFNQVVRTDGSGYINAGWINTISGNTVTASSDYYVNTSDGYIRKKTLALVQTEIVTNATVVSGLGYTPLSTGGGTITGGLSINHDLYVSGNSTVYGTFNAIGAIASAGNIVGSGTNLIQSIILDTHPESSTTVIPFINNDIAYLTLRGGSCIVNSGTVPLALFDGTPGYSVYDNTTWTTTLTSGYIVEITFHKTFYWGCRLGVSFGSLSFRSKTVTIEVYKFDTSVWEVASTTATNASSIVQYNGYYPSGISKMRFTFNDFNSFSASGFRISQIWLLNYSSLGIKETVLGRDGGSMYGGIYPQTDSVNSIGTNSNRWLNVYTDNLITTSLTVSSNTVVTNLNADTIDGYHASNLAGYAIAQTDIYNVNIPNGSGFFYAMTTALNNPAPGQWFQGMQFPTAANLTYRQILGSSNDGNLYFLSEANSVWQTPAVLYTSKNANNSATDWNVKILRTNATQGTPPLTVISTTLVSNLNAQYVGGYYEANISHGDTNNPYAVTRIDNDLNLISKSGFYFCGGNSLNVPIAAGAVTLMHGGYNGGDYIGFQIADHFSLNRTFLRTKSGSGTFYGWREIYTDSNSNKSTVDWSVNNLIVASNSMVSNLNAQWSTDLKGGLGGQIPYQTGIDATAFLVNGSVNQVLTSQGGTLAPKWTSLTQCLPLTGGNIIGDVDISNYLKASVIEAESEFISYGSIFNNGYLESYGEINAYGKLTKVAASLLTVPVSGTIEFDGVDFFITI